MSDAMTDKHPYADLDAKFRETKARIIGYEDLTDEAKARRTKEAELEYSRERAEIDKRLQEGREAKASAAFKRLHGPEQSTRSTQEEILREARLERKERELVPQYEANRRDPLVDYKRALRAGNADEMHVIAAHGERFLPDHTRRRELRRLVSENEPESVKRARRALAEAEREQVSADLAGGLRRQVRGRQGLTFSELGAGETPPR